MIGVPASGERRRPHVLGTVRALARYPRPLRRALGLGLLLAVVQVGIGLAQPWPLQWVVDNVLQPAGGDTPSDPERLLIAAALAFVVLVGSAAVVDYWSSRLLMASGLQLSTGLRAGDQPRARRRVVSAPVRRRGPRTSPW